MKMRTTIENIIDGTLFLLFTLPVTGFIIGQLYDFLVPPAIIGDSSGWAVLSYLFFPGPIIPVLLLVSLVIKIRKYRRGHIAGSKGERVLEILSIAPLFLIIAIAGLILGFSNFEQ